MSITVSSLAHSLTGSHDMLRPRPRLPAGPRTPKRTTSVQRQSGHESNEGQLPSQQHLPDLSSSSSVAFSSSPIVHPLTADPQREQPAPLLVTNELSPPNPDASQAIHSPSHNHPLLEGQHLSAQSTPSQVPADASRPATPTPLLTPASFETSPAPRKPSHATISSTIVPLTLPAAQIDFTPDPLPYQHLSLDAAHWALTSTELQHLVSSAIRQSAKEELIRLLPPSTIDTRMPEDAADIERTWDTAAARWRFEAHRRNMLLRALSASGADNDLLTQLSVTLSNLDLHAQSLLHAASHRAQLAAARDTHRASALAVALRKLNASYARRTRDLDKARAHIAVLRGEVEEAWKVAEEQADKVDKFKAVAMGVATEPHELSNADPEDSVVDDDNLYEDDTSSNALQDISCAEVIDVTGKAIAAQARLTMMRTDSQSSPRPPPSSYYASFPPSPATSSNNSQRQTTASRSSASRKRSRRKSKASLRLSIPVSVYSCSTTRGGSGARNARSKSRNKKGKELAQTESLVPANGEGSFLEMGGHQPRLLSGGGNSGEDHHDADESFGNGPQGDSSESAEPSPHLPLSNSTSIPESHAPAPPTPKTNVSQPAVSRSPLGDDISLVAVVPSASASAPEHISRCSTSSLPLTSPVPSALSTATIPPESEFHEQTQSPPLQSSDTHVEEKVAQGKVDLIPDPASIPPVSTPSKSTATTASMPDRFRRGYSLELTSLSASTNGGRTKSQNGGSKIRRSISEFLHFGTGSRIRRQSVPLSFKSRNEVTSLGTGASVIQQDLREESQEEVGVGWEDVRSDEA